MIGKQYNMRALSETKRLYIIISFSVVDCSIISRVVRVLVDCVSVTSSW